MTIRCYPRLDYSQHVAIKSRMKSRRYEIVDGTRRSPSIDSLSFSLSISFFFPPRPVAARPHATRDRIPPPWVIHTRFSDTWHAAVRHWWLVACKNVIMAYAPRCVSESRASVSSRSWRWKRERANWNLCLVHVTGADVYDFAKRESRSIARESWRNCVVFFDGRREMSSIVVSDPKDCIDMHFQRHVNSSSFMANI